MSNKYLEKIASSGLGRFLTSKFPKITTRERLSSINGVKHEISALGHSAAHPIDKVIATGQPIRKLPSSVFSDGGYGRKDSWTDDLNVFSRQHNPHAADRVRKVPSNFKTQKSMKEFAGKHGITMDAHWNMVKGRKFDKKKLDK